MQIIQLATNDLPHVCKSVPRISGFFKTNNYSQLGFFAVPYNFYFSGISSSSSGICIMIEKQTDNDFVEHIEIIPGKIQAFKVKKYERNVVL